MEKVKLILLQGRNMRESKGLYDPNKRIVKEYLNLILAKKGKHNYEADDAHFFYDKKGKLVLFIDVNARSSSHPIMTVQDMEMKGSSLDPPLAQDLDAQLMNKLDYLSEASFWEALNVRKRDILLILMAMGSGIALYSIFRIIISMLGYQVP